jgi:hypothetical protein
MQARSAFSSLDVAAQGQPWGDHNSRKLFRAFKNPKISHLPTFRQISAFVFNPPCATF